MHVWRCLVVFPLVPFVPFLPFVPVFPFFPFVPCVPSVPFTSFENSGEFLEIPFLGPTCPSGLGLVIKLNYLSLVCVDDNSTRGESQ